MNLNLSDISGSDNKSSIYLSSSLEILEILLNVLMLFYIKFQGSGIIDLINPIIITSAIFAISLAFLVIILKIWNSLIKKQNKAISKFLEKTEIIILALALVVASFTLYSSIDYSYKSQELLTKNILETKNISETNEEIVDWYKNPEPILINITNLFLNNTAFIRKYDNSTSLEELVEKSNLLNNLWN